MAERLKLLYLRLEAAPACRNPEEALTLITRTLDAIEDEWSGVSKNPNPPMKFEGRLYAPQSDFIVFLPDGGTRANTKKHDILLSAEGSIQFVHRTTQVVEFRKEGADN